MQLLRFMAIAVLVLACVVLGSACAGAKGVGIEDINNNDDGTLTIELTDGEEYTTESLKGDRGEPGPNMIVAMGEVTQGGAVNQGYNVTSCTSEAVIGGGMTYTITLTDISYDPDSYVTLLTYSGRVECYISYGGTDGKLSVFVQGMTGSPVYSGFSFMVLECP